MRFSMIITILVFVIRFDGVLGDSICSSGLVFLHNVYDYSSIYHL